jgi:hypothetical protein
MSLPIYPFILKKPGVFLLFGAKAIAAFAKILSTPGAPSADSAHLYSYAITGRLFERYIQATSGALPVKDERTASTSTGKVRYVGARQFQHVGVLFQDANKNGVLDSQDLLLHAGPRPLAPSLFSDGYFDGEAVIMRLP